MDTGEGAGGQFKKCRYCAEQIPADAIMCPRCNSLLTAAPQSTTVQPIAVPASTAGSGKGMAIASLVSGILGLLCCCIGSILAIVFGCVARNQMKHSGNMEGSGMATAGIVLGIVALILNAIGAIFFVLVPYLASSGTRWNF